MIADQTVFEAKRLGVLTCQEDCLLEKAAEYMVGEDVSALIVVDQEGFLSGIFTRTDLLRAGLTVDDWKSKLVKDFMSPNVVTVAPETRLSDVAKLLLEKQIHRVVVVSEAEGRRPLSVVSAADLVYHMVNEGQTLSISM